MSRRIAVVAAMALAAAVLAVIGAAAALSMLGNLVFGPGGKPLTQADVQRELARPAAASAGQPGPASATPSGPASLSVSGTFARSGGTVFASCSAGQVMLTSWIPAQGYRVDGVSRGPGASAWVKFRSSATEQTVSVTCVKGRPHIATATDNRGGGSAGGGGGGGGGGHGGGRGGGGSSGGSGQGGSSGGGGSSSGGSSSSSGGSGAGSGH